MTPTEAVTQMVAESGKSASVVSAEMGRCHSYISALVCHGTTPKADTLARIAAACGFRLTLVGHGQEIEIDGDGDAVRKLEAQARRLGYRLAPCDTLHDATHDALHKRCTCN